MSSKIKAVSFKLKSTAKQDIENKHNGNEDILKQLIQHTDDTHKKKMWLSTAIFIYTCLTTCFILLVISFSNKTIEISSKNIESEIKYCLLSDFILCINVLPKNNDYIDEVKFTISKIDNSVLITLLTTFFAHIVGLMLVIVRYLFVPKTIKTYNSAS